MIKYHLVLDFNLVLSSPLHITGDRRLWAADRATARSATGDYTIPATSLKGCLRSAAEAILKTWSPGTVCDAPQPEQMCRDVTALCLVCRVFGNPRRASALKFSDAVAADCSRVAGSIRSGVSIGRQRRAALSERLFFVETAASQPGNAWIARAEGFFQASDAALEAAALVWLAARYRHAVGAGATRGLGWVYDWRIRATLNEEQCSETDFRPLWNAWSGGQNV